VLEGLEELHHGVECKHGPQEAGLIALLVEAHGQDGGDNGKARAHGW
jgi:hypothetical protein